MVLYQKIEIIYSYFKPAPAKAQGNTTSMYKPRITSIYIFKEILVPFLVSLGVFTFVLLMFRITDLTNLVIASGVGVDVVGLLLLYTLPYFFVFTVPMATLLGVLLGFVRLSSDNEITVMKASGISLWQMLPPVAILAIAAWLISFALALWALPWGNYQFSSLVIKIASENTELTVKERTFLNSFPGLLVYITKLPGDGVLEDIFIVDERDPENSNTVIAKSGRIYPIDNGKLTIRLYNGSMHSVNQLRGTAQTATFETYDLNMSAPGAASGHKSQKSEKEMYFSELMEALRQTPPSSPMYNSLHMELQKMFALPLGCLVMAVIGLPLGIHSRGGRSWGIAVAMMVFFIYYLMLSAAWSFGSIGIYPPKIGIWMPDIVFAILGVMLFRRELRETPYQWQTQLERMPSRLLNRLRGSGDNS
jgi:lipopolysaccharide export system permease protein